MNIIWKSWSNIRIVCGYVQTYILFSTQSWWQRDKTLLSILCATERHVINKIHLFTRKVLHNPYGRRVVLLSSRNSEAVCWELHLATYPNAPGALTRVHNTRLAYGVQRYMRNRTVPIPTFHGSSTYYKYYLYLKLGRYVCLSNKFWTRSDLSWDHRGCQGWVRGPWGIRLD